MSDDPKLDEEVQRAQRKLMQLRRRAGVKSVEVIPPLPIPECAKSVEKEPDPANGKLIERINEALAIQEQEAKAAGKLGYIGRVHTQATIPHSNWDPVTEYERQNGNFHL